MTHIPYYVTPQQAWPLTRPGAVTTFYVYCGLMVLLYLFVTAAGVFYYAMAAEMAADEPNMTVQEARILGGIMMAMGLFFALLFAIPPFLPRAMWAWIIGIIAIALGLTSCCLWPLCIPLLIYYVNAKTRAWYGMGG